MGFLMNKGLFGEELPSYTTSEARSAEARSQAALNVMVRRLQSNPERLRCKVCKQMMQLTPDTYFVCTNHCAGLISPAKLYEEYFNK